MYTQIMSAEKPRGPTQKTGRGLEIPVPTRREVEDTLDKMAKSKKPSILPRRPKK
jgi:hypothetical protein